MNKIENYTQQAINIANDNRHGYSQYNRWGYPDYDCSSLIISVVQNSGIPVKSNGATYTGNMYKTFIKSGFKDVTKSVDLRSGRGLKRGDVLLNHIHHTEIYIGNGKSVSARISELGTTYGKNGDQTGNEINTHKYYNYPWNAVLRYPVSVSKSNDNYITLFAKDVIRGKYGSGTARKQNIYTTVQNEVNNILYKRKLKNNYVTEIATKVIQGKYGSGDTRKNKLYNEIQAKVNKMI